MAQSNLCRRTRITAIGLLGIAVIASVVHASAEVVIPEACQWSQLVRDIGFPICVAAFLLFRHDATVRDLTKAIDRLNEKCPMVLSPRKD